MKIFSLSAFLFLATFTHNAHALNWVCSYIKPNQDPSAVARLDQVCKETVVERLKAQGCIITSDTESTSREYGTKNTNSEHVTMRVWNVLLASSCNGPIIDEANGEPEFRREYCEGGETQVQPLTDLNVENMWIYFERRGYYGSVMSGADFVCRP